MSNDLKILTDSEIQTLNNFAERCHAYAREKGWWTSQSKKVKEALNVILKHIPKASEAEIENIARDLVLEEIIAARSSAEIQMLCVTELAEATEEVRNKKPDIYGILPDGKLTTDLDEIRRNKLKPEGEAVEFADCMIRMGDYFGFKGWNLGETVALKQDYNVTRSYRHGGKAF